MMGMVEAFGAEHSVSEVAIFRVNLEFDELVTNYLVHRLPADWPARMAIRIRLFARRLVLVVADTGPPRSILRMWSLFPNRSEKSRPSSVVPACISSAAMPTGFIRPVLVAAGGAPNLRREAGRECAAVLRAYGARLSAGRGRRQRHRYRVVRGRVDPDLPVVELAVLAAQSCLRASGHAEQLVLAPVAVDRSALPPRSWRKRRARPRYP